MRCVWLSGECPDGVDSGLLAYSRGLSEALARSGVEVEGLGLARPVAADVGLVRWTRVGSDRRSSARSVGTRLPAMAFAFATPEYRAALQAAASRRFDAVIVDHLQMGWAIDDVRVRWPRIPIVHVSHNHETSVRAEVARRAGFPRRAVLEWDARKVAWLERRVVDAADLVTAITRDDAERFEPMLRPPTRVVVVEPGYGGEEAPERRFGGSVARRAVVLGSFEWHVKETNLRELLDAADPVFAAAGAEIRVVGAVRDAFRTEMQRRLRATTFAGRVPAVAEELRDARLGIVAEPRGGGFKMKALDYVFHRLPVATVRDSAKGLPLVPGESVFEYPDVAALAAGAVAVLDDDLVLDRVADAALAACRPAFDWTARGRALRDAIERVAFAG